MLEAATALAAASAVLGVLGAGTAAAQPVSLTLGYTCSFPYIGDQPIKVKIDSDIPNSVAVGKPSKKFAVNAVATVGANVTLWLATAGVKTVEGTADAKTDVAAPEGEFSVIVPFHMAKTTIPVPQPEHDGIGHHTCYEFHQSDTEINQIHDRQ